jgi:outer membrane receptor protein involved in Fe transport
MPGTAVPNPTNVRQDVGGNPNLPPELADTLTYGVVWRPTSSFSVALDAFNIKVKNAIFQTQANDTFVQAVCYASKGASPLCQFITRALGNYTDTSAANAVIAVKQQFVNAAENDTSGADVEVNFRTSLATHALNLRLLTTYQPHDTFARDGAPTLDFSGTYGGSGGFIATPVWRSSLAYLAEPQLFVASPKIKAIGYTNVNLDYASSAGAGKLDVFFNIANIANTDPARASFCLNQNPAGNDVAQGDDVTGRYYTLGLRYQR